MNWSKLKHHPTSQHTVSPLMPCTYIWYFFILVRDSMLTQEKNGGSMPLATMPGPVSIALIQDQKRLVSKSKQKRRYKISHELP